MAVTIGKLVKDIIFPSFCVECGKEGKYCCEKCEKKLIEGAEVSCIYFNGRDQSYLNGVLTFFNYKEGEIFSKLIKIFKYNFVLEINEVWNNVITAYSKNLEVYKDCMVVPVPLHPRRERMRGFNQANEIAKCVASLPLWEGVKALKNDLHRNRYTEKQASLKREERIANLNDAFEWSGISVPPQVLLVDDVYTTGTTMQKCAEVLKKRGVKKVYGLCLAKGEYFLP